MLLNPMLIKKNSLFSIITFSIQLGRTPQQIPKFINRSRRGRFIRNATEKFFYTQSSANFHLDESKILVTYVTANWYIYR